jgi:hypothetical protein
VYLGTLLRRVPLHVVLSFLIVAGLIGALDLAMRPTATETIPLTKASVSQHEPELPSDKNTVSVGKSSDVSETGSLSAALVPLPERKPQRVYKGPSGNGASVANAATQKRMTHRQKKRDTKRQGTMAH